MDQHLGSEAQSVPDSCSLPRRESGNLYKRKTNPILITSVQILDVLNFCAERLKIAVGDQLDEFPSDLRTHNVNFMMQILDSNFLRVIKSCQILWSCTPAPASSSNKTPAIHSSLIFCELNLMFTQSCLYSPTIAYTSRISESVTRISLISYQRSISGFLINGSSSDPDKGTSSCQQGY